MKNKVNVILSVKRWLIISFVYRASVIVTLAKFNHGAVDDEASVLELPLV